MPQVFWVQKQDIGPSPRANHGMAYLTSGQRAVVFGGDPGGPPLADTWAWDGNLWTQVADTGPSARHGLSLSEGPAGGAQRLVLFGGVSGATFLADTWTFDGSDWIQVADTGPGARAGHAAAYDPIRQRLVLFGGDNGALLQDTWAWDGTDWTQVDDGGPTARRGHAMAFDEGRGRIILFGGAGANGTGLDDTWAWDGSAWTQIADTGPEPRLEATMAGIGSLLLFGGVNSVDPALAPANRIVFGDTWQLTAQGWSKVQDIGPAGRWGHGATVAKVGAAPGHVVLFGGAATFALAQDAALVPSLQGDTWEVPDVAAAGGTPQPPALQITSVSVQPNQIPLFGNFVQISVTIITNVAPPAGTGPTIGIVRGPSPNWTPQLPPGFTIPPVVFSGASTVTTFSIVRDTTFLGMGQYGVAVSIGTGPKVVGAFFMQ
jgi:galactose oxidase-like protein